MTERLSGTELAKTFADSVNVGGNAHGHEFAVQLVDRTHNTLQQAAFGYMLQAIYRWSEATFWDARNEATITACKKIVAENPDLFLNRGERVIPCLPCI